MESLTRVIVRFLAELVECVAARSIGVMAIYHQLTPWLGELEVPGSRQCLHNVLGANTVWYSLAASRYGEEVSP
jgi:hypothetical protein